MAPRITRSFAPRSATRALALALGAVLGAGCDRLIGIKDPTLGEAPVDAAPLPDAPPPGLASAVVPLRFAVSDSDQLTFIVYGRPGSAVGWSIEASNGSFEPPDGSVPINQQGDTGTFTVRYTATTTTGDHVHRLRMAFSPLIEESFVTSVRVLAGAGQANPFADNAGISVPADFLYGQQITLPRSAYVMRLGFHAQLAGGSGRMALYTNNAGAPGALIVGSKLEAVVVGPNERRVVPTLVEAGTYWLLGNFSAVTPVKRDAASSTGLAYAALSTTAEFPAQLVAPMATNNRVLNYYLRFAE